MESITGKIKIITQTTEFCADLYNTPTARKIAELLPISANSNTWGKEVYFTLPVIISEEVNARDILVPGEIAFWPVGKAFCIFFGPTPVSTDERPRAYGVVNVFGKITGDLSKLIEIRSGDPIRIEAIR